MKETRRSVDAASFQVLLHLLLEEIVGLLVLYHLLLPGRALDVLAHLQQVFEIVEGEDAQALVDDEHRQEADLHVDVGRQPHPAPRRRDRTVLYDVELILELDQVGVPLYLYSQIFLELEVRGDGLRVEKYGVVSFEPVVGSRIEVGLSVGEQGDVSAGEADLGISAHFLQLFGIVGKGHVLLEEVHLRHNAEEVLYGDF